MGEDVRHQSKNEYAKKLVPRLEKIATLWQKFLKLRNQTLREIQRSAKTKRQMLQTSRSRTARKKVWAVDEGV
jgi:hypothetical protein